MTDMDAFQNSVLFSSPDQLDEPEPLWDGMKCLGRGVRIYIWGIRGGRPNVMLNVLLRY